MLATRSLLALLVASTFASGAMSEESDSSFALGLGIGYETSVYKGIDAKATALPLILYENGGFYVRGPELGYFFFNDNAFKIGPAVRYKMDGYDAGDSDDLTGMDDRDGTVEAGIVASYATNYGDWSMAAFADAGGTHDGYQIDLGWENQFRLNENWALIPEASVSYGSADRNNYYFGVTAKEANANRAAYESGGDFSYEVGLSAQYMIDRNQMVRIGVSYEGYGSKISDSLIVDKSHSSKAGVVYVYRF